MLNFKRTINSLNTSESNSIFEKNKIEEYHLDFVFNKKIPEFGLIINNHELKNFFNKMEADVNNDKLSNKKDNAHRIRFFKELKPQLINHLKSKYNSNFFKKNSLVFHQITGVGSNIGHFFDSVSYEDNKILLNFVNIHKLYFSEFGSYPPVPTIYFTSRLSLVSIPKIEKNTPLKINEIDTIEKFQSYAGSQNYKKYSKQNTINPDWVKSLPKIPLEK